MTTLRVETTYVRRPGARYGEDDVQAVGETIEALKAKYDGVTPSLVVDAARCETSPLHKHFVWDDTRAGELYRKAQARELITSYEIVVNGEARPASASVVINIPEPEEGEEQQPGQQVYINYQDMLSDEDLRLQHLRSMLIHIHGYRDKLTDHPEAQGLVREIDKLWKKVSRATADRDAA